MEPSLLLLDLDSWFVCGCNKTGSGQAHEFLEFVYSLDHLTIFTLGLSFLTTTAQAEIEAGKRFAFGANWSRFLRHIDQEGVESAKRSLQQLLGLESLEGKRFLDAGCGSGLFSLAAFQLGAEVLSFDFDPNSVACAGELKRREQERLSSGAFAENRWKILSGSVLDREFLESLGQFDIVYSWGVLHHTGEMKLAAENVSERVVPGGLLSISLYNDQGGWSQYWTWVKRSYNRSVFLRIPIVLWHLPYLGCGRWLVRRLKGKGRLERGMSIWYDMIDWLGGYPFEVAKPNEVADWFEPQGFQLVRLIDVGKRMGCNEYVFRAASKGETK